MKIEILGTAAYERVPALFCNCAACQLARKKNGKYIRTQAQTLIDEQLLIDFGMDNYLHYVLHKKDFSAVQALLLTHAHPDHFQSSELTMRGSCYGHDMHCENMQIYGNDECHKSFLQNPEVYACQFNTIEAYKTIQVGKYTVVSVPANHGTTNPLCYIITDGDKSIFYSLDTGFLKQETYEWIGKMGYVFDLVICDCTFGVIDCIDCGGHMSLKGNAKHRELLKDIGAISKDTQWIITHFSHNGLLKDGNAISLETLEKLAAEQGMMVAFDGICIEI